MPNTREELIELIRDGRYKAESICNANKDCQRCTIADPNGNCKYGCIADHLIANGVTVQQWIPVTERLPEKNGEYLCRWINKSVGDAEYESTYGSFGYWFDFWEDEYKDWIAYDGITHWMPLPEPPKEADQ